jgi:hypothetical protein
MEGGVGPLVDGRPYLDDSNYEKIESYHRAAVEAHYNHEKPSVEIPHFA